MSIPPWFITHQALASALEAAGIEAADRMPALAVVFKPAPPVGRYAPPTEVPNAHRPATTHGERTGR